MRSKPDTGQLKENRLTGTQMRKGLKKGSKCSLILKLLFEKKNPSFSTSKHLMIYLYDTVVAALLYLYTN